MPSVDATEFPPVSVIPSSAETPGVASYTSRMPDLIALQKLQGKLFRDQRNLIYDPAVGIDSASWTKWIKIYQSAEYKNYSPEFVELAPGLRHRGQMSGKHGTVSMYDRKPRILSVARL